MVKNAENIVEAQTKAALELREAFGRYFAGRATVIQGDPNELLRIGRPIAHRRDLYGRLSAATIELKAYPAVTPEPAV